MQYICSGFYTPRKSSSRSLRGFKYEIELLRRSDVRRMFSVCGGGEEEVRQLMGVVVGFSEVW